MKKIVAVSLLVSILSLMLSSCSIFECKCDTCGRKCEGCEEQENNEPEAPVKDGENEYHYLFPENYTGGFIHQPGANVEYWWVETYDEVLEAVNLLKSHGSTFSDDTKLTYDGEFFDTKYCFVISGVGSETEKIKWGDNPFDRYAKNVRIDAYAFFDDVSIEEINRSYLFQYDVYLFGAEPAYKFFKDNITEYDISISDWLRQDPYMENQHKYYKEVYINNQSIIYIRTNFYVNEGDRSGLKMTDECISDIVLNGKLIELNV